MNKTFSSQKEVKVEHDQRHRRNADKGEIMSTGDTNKKRNAFLSGQVRLHQQSELSDTLWEGLTQSRAYTAAVKKTKKKAVAEFSFQNQLTYIAYQSSEKSFRDRLLFNSRTAY